MKISIELKNMHFFAYHGVLEHETIHGNNFSVTLRFSADLSEACISDEVVDTVNYAEVYELVKEEMATPSKLIEHAAYRILRRVKEAFPRIDRVEVELSKMNPPVTGQMDHSAVIISE
ncbi:MAG: dihydroneopterin aldolase [Proteiniphilum sp.]|uniref:dihydroneopterin aldolase n=1 Tax=Proteiniphilum sp. TaxID=1926877 RepID=UPI002B2124C3|nr:dihydroneopterin aldolase [Proteiniphilum sp.]MEA5128113.1 dihydroneopterin aldolase [Proteiniphilum sp.]